MNDLIYAIKEAFAVWKRRRAYRKFRATLPDPFTD